MALGVVSTGVSAAAGPALPTVVKAVASYTDTAGTVSSGSSSLATDSTGAKLVVGASSTVDQPSKITATKVAMTAVPTLFGGIVPSVMGYDESYAEATGFVQVTSQENGSVYFVAIGFENANKRAGVKCDLDGQEVSLFSGDGVGGSQGIFSNQAGVHCGGGVTQGSVFNFPALKNNGCGLGMPQATTVQRDAVNGGFIDGVFFFNSTDKTLQIYSDSQWKTVATLDAVPAFPSSFPAIDPTTHTSGSPYAASYNQVLLGDFTTTGTAYVSLPVAASGNVGRKISAKVKITGAASKIRLTAQSGETVDGAAFYELEASAKNAVELLVSATGEWIVI